MLIRHYVTGGNWPKREHSEDIWQRNQKLQYNRLGAEHDGEKTKRSSHQSRKNATTIMRKTRQLMTKQNEKLVPSGEKILL